MCPNCKSRTAPLVDTYCHGCHAIYSVEELKERNSRGRMCKKYGCNEKAEEYGLCEGHIEAQLQGHNKG